MTFSNSRARDPVGVLEGYTPGVHYVPSRRDMELAERIDSLYRDSFAGSGEFRADAVKYHDALRGRQIVVHRDSGEVLQLRKKDYRRLRSQNNILRPSARSLVGKLTRNIPLIRVSAPSYDYEDQNAAKVLDAALSYQARRLDLPLLYQRTCEYLPWAGNGFLYLWWDSNAGETAAVCQKPDCPYVGEASEVGAPCPACAMETQGQPQGPEMPLEGLPYGDCQVSVTSPLDTFFPRGARTIDESPWFMLVHSYPVSTLRMRFPKFAAFLTEDYSSATHQQSSSRGEDITGAVASGAVPDDNAWLYTFHEKPTWAYPKGRVIYKVNNYIVDEQEAYWFELGRFPLYQFGWDIVEDDVFFEPAFANAWHRQKEITNNETAIREHTELGLRPKLLVALQSKITDDEISARTQQIIHWSAHPTIQNPVIPFPTQPVPQDLWQRSTVLAADIRYQMGLTQADTGNMGSDPNASAAGIAVSEADTMLDPVRRRNNAEWKALHLGLAKLMQKYYSEERVIRAIGPDGYQKYYWKQMKLDYVDIELEEHDGLSSNPVTRFQQALDLFQMGYFMVPETGQPDKKAFARAARLHVPDKGYEAEATEVAAASSIPEKLKRGVLVVPQVEDATGIFIEELMSWLRGPGRQPDEPPEVVEQVRQIMMQYMQWEKEGAGVGEGSMQPGVPLNAPQGPSMPGQTVTAPGGSPSNQTPTDKGNANVANADRFAKSAANSGQPHK